MLEYDWDDNYLANSMLNLWICGCKHRFIPKLPEFFLEDDKLRLGKLANKKLGESKDWYCLTNGFDIEIAITQHGSLINYPISTISSWESDFELDQSLLRNIE